MEWHSTWNGTTLNHPTQRQPSKVSSHQLESTKASNNYTPCLALLLTSNDSTILYYYNAHVSLPHPQIAFTTKTVFGKIGDTYQAYCNTYKIQAMATYHKGSGSPLDRDTDATRETLTTVVINVEDTQAFNPVETDQFEDLEHNNPTKLIALTREVDDLHQ